MFKQCSVHLQIYTGVRANLLSLHCKKFLLLSVWCKNCWYVHTSHLMEQLWFVLVCSRKTGKTKVAELDCKKKKNTQSWHSLHTSLQNHHTFREQRGGFTTYNPVQCFPFPGTSVCTQSQHRVLWILSDLYYKLLASKRLLMFQNTPWPCYNSILLTSEQQNVNCWAKNGGRLSF